MSEYFAQPAGKNMFSTVRPVYQEPELAQTFSLLYMCFYHCECLVTVVGNNMNTHLNLLLKKICDIRDYTLSAVIGHLRDVDISSMSTTKFLEFIAPKTSPYPLPSSILKVRDYMKDVPSTGLVLEYMAEDWLTLRSVCGALLYSI